MNFLLGKGDSRSYDLFVYWKVSFQLEDIHPLPNS